MVVGRGGRVGLSVWLTKVCVMDEGVCDDATVVWLFARAYR